MYIWASVDANEIGIKYTISPHDPSISCAQLSLAEIDRVVMSPFINLCIITRKCAMTGNYLHAPWLSQKLYLQYYIQNLSLKSENKC